MLPLEIFLANTLGFWSENWFGGVRSIAEAGGFDLALAIRHVKPMVCQWFYEVFVSKGRKGKEGEGLARRNARARWGFI